MRQYRVISRYAVKDACGVTIGYQDPPAVVELSEADAERLIKAACVVPAVEEPQREKAVIDFPEKRRRRGWR